MHAYKNDTQVYYFHFSALWLLLALWFQPSGQNFWPSGFIDSAVQIRPYEPTSIKVFTINPATLLATLAFDQQTTIISIFVNFSKFLKINVKSVKFSTSKYVKFTQTLH